MIRQLTVAHVLAPGAPLDAAALLERFRAKGWDAHLIHDGSSPALLERIADLPEDIVLRAVHPPPRMRRAHRQAETGRLLAGLLGSLGRRPAAVAAILRPRGVPGQNRLSSLYCDAVTAALRPRIVHFHSAEAADGRVSLGHRLGAEVIVSLSDADLAAIGLPGADLQWLETADALVVPAGPIGRRALGRGLPADRCVMLPLPETRADSLGPETGDGLRILSIGELDWRQGYEHGIHAVRLLTDRGVRCHYRLVGAGAHEGALRFARRQLRLETNVDLLGSPVTAGIGRQLVWADVFLDPAVAATPTGFAQLAVELGVPVVAARGTSSEEPVGEIFQVRRRDPWALADRLAALAAGPELLPRRAARAASVEEPLSVEALADRLAALYLRLLEGRPPIAS